MKRTVMRCRSNCSRQAWPGQAVGAVFAQVSCRRACKAHMLSADALIGRSKSMFKKSYAGHVIVGVMTITTDIDKLYDTDLTDAAWALIAPMLPAARRGGRPRTDQHSRCVKRNLLSTTNRLPMAFASPRVSSVEHGLSLLPSLEERWCLDLCPALNLPAGSTASRPDRLSLGRHYGRPVGEDHGTWRHSRIRRAQACERPQAPYFGGHLWAADRMQSRASRHLRPKGGCPVARWLGCIIPEHSHSHSGWRTPKSKARSTPVAARWLEATDRQTSAACGSRSQASPGL